LTDEDDEDEDGRIARRTARRGRAARGCQTPPGGSPGRSPASRLTERRRRV